MNSLYELCRDLKEAGYPQNHQNWDADLRFCPDCISESDEDGEMAHLPTLEELIEACGPQFDFLRRKGKTWIAYSSARACGQRGSTPKEALMRLWLALNPKKV